MYVSDSPLFPAQLRKSHDGVYDDSERRAPAKASTQRPHRPSSTPIQSAQHKPSNNKGGSNKPRSHNTLTPSQPASTSTRQGSGGRMSADASGGGSGGGGRRGGWRDTNTTRGGEKPRAKSSPRPQTQGGKAFFASPDTSSTQPSTHASDPDMRSSNSLPRQHYRAAAAQQPASQPMHFPSVDSTTSQKRRKPNTPSHEDVSGGREVSPLTLSISSLVAQLTHYWP